MATNSRTMTSEERGKLVASIAQMRTSLTKAVRWQSSLRRAQTEDLENGVVTEEAFHFTETKRLQEHEHGGLIYFLRTVDNRVYVLFDYESQDLGVDEQDPLTSTFRPHEKFVMARAPKSRMILGNRFFGGQLELPTPMPITVPPSKWPTFEAYCDTPWEQLDTKFCRPTTGSRRRRR